MIHPVETEIKLAASSAMLANLRAHPALSGDERTRTLVTTYFDTPDGRLRRGGGTLRIRDGGGGREQTFKLSMPGGASVRRGEWNAPLAGDRPDAAGFPARARTALARLVGGAALEPVATTRMERTTRRLHFGRSTIEIAFDLGTVEAGGREQAICELEIELVAGHLANVVDLALLLPLGPDLAWSVSSKAERCQLLVRDQQPAAVRAVAPGLSGGMDVAAGFQAIGWNCLGQLLANYPLVIASGDPEAVHQCRVAIRRLRAACALFHKVADDDAAPLLRAELQAVAGALSPSRDLHVLAERVSRWAVGGCHDANELLAHLGVRQARAMRSAQELLSGPSFQRLLFECAGWIENGEWLRRKGETGGDGPLVSFAAHTLSKRRENLRRRAARLADMSDAERHALRIVAKKLRYGAEFFAPLFRGGKSSARQGRFVTALAGVQESLGELNDAAAAGAMRTTPFDDIEPIAAARLRAQLEDILAGQGDARGKLLKAAGRSLARAASAHPWWKVE